MRLSSSRPARWNGHMGVLLATGLSGRGKRAGTRVADTSPRGRSWSPTKVGAAGPEPSTKVRWATAPGRHTLSHMDTNRLAGRRARWRVGWRGVLTDRRVVDMLVVVGCLVLTALAVKTPWSTLPRPAIAVIGLLGSTAQWPRRRWPHLAVAVGAATYALSGNPGPLLVGSYAVAAYGPRRLVWLAVVVGAAGFAGRSWLDAGAVTVNDIAYGALAAGLTVAVGSYAATRTALLASLHERARQAEEQRRLREERARAAERGRIAREMHDVLAHKVSLIALYAGALELHAGSNDRLREGTALIHTTAREALQELRSVLGMLHRGSDAEPESTPDIAALVAASTRAGHTVELHDRSGTMPPPTARVVHRIVQEGLTNVHKHAPGAATTVSLEQNGEPDSPRGLTVTVRNTAGTHEPMDAPGSGAGLVGLADRVRLVGGSLRSGPTDLGGWEMHAVVPWLDAGFDRPAEEAG
ncbi:MAG: two-component sensor histidine kinase [Pseudonocardiaceae bacterium]|nr:two-component sensor histidine kinase [Pseudonocardiaceae bacterium]